MNFVFWIIIFLTLFFFWAISTELWDDIGEILTDIINDIKGEDQKK